MEQFIIKANEFNQTVHVSNVFVMRNWKLRIWKFTFHSVRESSVESVPPVQTMIILIVVAFPFMIKQQQFAVQLNGDAVSSIAILHLEIRLSLPNEKHSIFTKENSWSNSFNRTITPNLNKSLENILQQHPMTLSKRVACLPIQIWNASLVI